MSRSGGAIALDVAIGLSSKKCTRMHRTSPTQDYKSLFDDGNCCAYNRHNTVNGGMIRRFHQHCSRVRDAEVAGSNPVAPIL